MSKLSKRHFWEWFKRHNKEYLELDKKTKKEAGYWLNELSVHLRAYFKFLGFSITFQENGVKTLAITVNGKAQHFKKVDALAALAPELPGWKITALEEPMPFDYLMEKELENAGIDPAELCFLPSSDDPANTGIIVYHSLCTEENERLFLRLITAVVYHLLGERSYGMDIGYIEVANLSCTGSEEVIKLDELPEWLDSRRSSMVVGPNGMLMSR